MYGFLALVVIFLARLRHSRMGRAFEAVKLDETAAEAMGVNVTRAKLIAFATGAFVAGVGGALYAHHAVFIQYDNFDFKRGVDIAMYMVLGGMDVFYGPLLGAFIITYLSTALQFLADWRWEVWGIIVILVMIFRPRAFWGGIRSTCAAGLAPERLRQRELPWTQRAKGVMDHLDIVEPSPVDIGGLLMVRRRHNEKISHAPEL